jgi:hypothetical protein
MASNLERQSVSGRLGVTPVEGRRSGRCAAGPRWRLIGVGRIRCSGPRFSMRFSPTALGQCGEPILLTLGGRWTTMAAGMGGLARLKLNIDGGGLRGSCG